MRQKISLVLVIFMVVALMSTVSAPVSSVQADGLLQEPSRLDGYHIYFTEAGAEASRFDRSVGGLSRLAGLLQQQGAELHTLEWRARFPTDADLIIMTGPTSDLSSDQTARLWSYLNNNGRLLLLAEPRVGSSRALPSTSGLFNLMWSDMGIRARDDVVVTEGFLQPEQATDEAETTGTPTPAEESETIGTPLPTAESPTLIADFTTTSIEANHPITAEIDDGLVFFVARSIEIDASQGFRVTSLIFSSNNFYGETSFADYLDEDVAEYNIGGDIARGALPLAGAFENPVSGTRVVLIGDRDFATNGGGLQTSPPNSASFLYPGNPRFLLNAVTWLLDVDAVELTFPTPGPTATVTITPSPTVTSTLAPTSTPNPYNEIEQTATAAVEQTATAAFELTLTPQD